MQQFYIDQAQRVDFDLAIKCILSPQAKAEWWVTNLTLHMVKRCFPKLSDMEIFSDASLTGWGRGVNTNGSYPTGHYPIAADIFMNWN